jgi:hypothetical protein
MRKQVDFPLLDKYKKKFKITPYTIFAYNKEIYSDYPLTEDLLIHELKHIERQNKIGVDNWVDAFLNNDAFRLNEEVIAYKAQINSISDRNERYKLKLLCAKNLSSDLYGDLVSYEEALKLL